MVALPAVRPRKHSWTWLALIALVAATPLLIGVRDAIIAGTLAMDAVYLVFFLRHAAFAAASMRWAGRDIYDVPPASDTYWPSVTVLVACHNEELTVGPLVRGLAALHYPNRLLQVVLVNDGSTDDTGPMLDELASHYPNMSVIHRPVGTPGGKSGALNEGARAAAGEILVVFDADHIPRRNVISALVRHFRDPRVGAVQGRCVIRNSVQSKLARSVAIDYFSGYLVNEYGRQALFGLPAYGGANCAVRADTLRALGGWNEESVTEDTDLTLRLILAGQQLRYDINAVDTEEAATTIRRFMSQRYRWARGHQKVWRDYRWAVLRSPYLSLSQKVETILFLLVYHVPVLCFGTLILTVLRIAGIGPHVTVFEMLPLAALMFVGPFCELASGLLVGRAPRRAIWSVAWLTPLFFVTMYLSSKAWVDGLIGRPYRWVKTQRSNWDALAGSEQEAA
jgi:1,2-diacylglycerol 3-beta-glucosyltransferase